MSVKQFIIISQKASHKFIMRYNELSYHKANPFYKQDYLPDRAWYNRKPKEYPSEIPTGQQYFTDNGRKHYAQKFNHSEIEQCGVLKSPQRYPFQNRLALDKTYMRNLDTIDIEGAASGTRMNQSIKNKLKAQQDLARRYNQSLDMRQHKQKTYDEKRRQMAIKQFETINDKRNKPIDSGEGLNVSRISNNPEKERLQYQMEQPIYAQQTSNYGSKYVNLLPKPYYSHIDQGNVQKQNLKAEIEKQSQKYSNYQQQSNKYIQQYQQHQLQNQQYQTLTNQQQSKRSQSYSNRQKQPSQREQNHYPILANNRHKSNPQYYNAYDAEWLKRRDQYSKTMEMDQISKNQLQDRKQFRKHNPTNLSFNLAAQSIVANMH